MRATQTMSIPSFWRRIVQLFLLVSLAVALGSCEKAGREVKVESFEPTGEIEPMTTFEIVFSQPVIGDSLVGRTFENGPLRFRPEVQGVWRWQSHRKAIFTPYRPLRHATEYVVLRNPYFDPNLRIKVPKIRLRTPSLKVLGVDLRIRVDQATAKAFLVGTIKFNYPVPPEDLQQHIGAYDEKGRRHRVEVMSPDTSTIEKRLVVPIRVGPVIQGKKDHHVLIKVFAGLRCKGCKLGLERDFETKVLVPKKGRLIVENVRVRRTDSKVAEVEISFNRYVEKDQVVAHLSLKPSIDFAIHERYASVTIEGPFRSDTTYSLVIHKGLVASDGSVLDRDFEHQFTVGELLVKPQMRWVGSGYYLPPDGHLNLGLFTINVEKVRLKVSKVYANNLVYMLHEIAQLTNQRSWINYGRIRQIGTDLSEQEIAIAAERNQEKVTPIDVRPYVRTGGKGIYLFRAEVIDDWWGIRYRWLLVTNLGIVAKVTRSGIWVWVNSLSDLTPVVNARVTLLSDNNQTIATALTDQDGVAVLKHFNREEELVPFVIVVEKGQDFAFLRVRGPGLQLSDFETAGVQSPEKGYWAYLYGDRDIYRPGEKVHVVAVVRDARIHCPKAFPVKLQIVAPDKRIVDELRANLNDQGAAEFTVTTRRYWATGTYTAKLLLGQSEEIGRYEFDLQEFIPDRIKVTLQLKSTALVPEDTLEAKVQAVNLFGPPAVGRVVRSHVRLEPQNFKPVGWRDFSFGKREDDETKTMSEDLPELRTDSLGIAKLRWFVPREMKPGLVYRGSLAATVLEPNGRAVTDRAFFEVFTSQVYVGLRQMTTGFVPVNSSANFQLIVLNKNSEVVSDRRVKVQIYRRIWNSVLKKIDKRWGPEWRWVSRYEDIPFDSFTVVSKQDPVRFNVTPKAASEYRIVATDEQTGSQTILFFDAGGWEFGPWAVRGADRLRLVLSKEQCQAGETVELQIRSPYSGKLLLTFERAGVFEYRVYDLKKNTATIRIPTKDLYIPNIYLWAQVIRKPSEVKEGEAARAYGLARLAVKPKNKALGVELITPDVIRPKSKLKVQVRLKGFETDHAYLTLAAVDEGICQLTGFKPPNPWNLFYGVRRLSVRSYDTYGVMLPDVGNQSSPAGGVWRARQLLAPVAVQRVKPVALWSGLVKVDGDGRTTLDFSVPQFNGSLRLMAVAWKDDRFGSASKKVIVRDPIVVSPTLPRFVACGDSFIVPVRISNGTEARKQVEITVQTVGPARILGKPRAVLDVPPNAERFVAFAAKADTAVGELRVIVQAKAAGVKVRQTTNLAVQAPVPPTSIVGSGGILAGRDTSFVMPGTWLRGTGKYTIAFSSTPLIKFRESLAYLVHYPYGCVEQTTSSAFPLLYLRDLARKVEPSLGKSGNIDYFINEAIRKLEGMQLEDGEFSFWPGEDHVYKWGSLYASHFMVEAKKAGYEVSNRVYRKMLEALRRIALEFSSGDRRANKNAAYACYVLALAGKPARAAMLALKNNYWLQLDSESRSFLAAAFALTGDVSLASSLLPRHVNVGNKQGAGGCFWSPIRAQAVFLSTLAEVNPKHPAIPELVRNLTSAAERAGRWYTTQENAFALLALGKLLHQLEEADYSGELLVEGKKLGDFGVDSRVFSGDNWGGKKIEIRLQGKGICYFSWVSRGVEKGLWVKPKSDGIKIRRTYLDATGKPVALSTVRQGDLVICHLEVEATDVKLENVAIVDVLPAGLEIENPRLESREDIPWLADWSFEPDYLDLRDDRVILFTTLPASERKHYYYALRAVTAGEFTVPPLHVEAMYAPEYQATGGGGVLRVLSLGR